ESEFERVGGLKTLEVDVRLVAATNRDLRKEIERGAFREDLFYRLNVVPLHLPPLRERTEDIRPLGMYFLSKFNARLQKTVARIDRAATSILERYPWPGNIRELENALERAVLFADGEAIEPDHLPREVVAGVALSVPSDPSATVDDGDPEWDPDTDSLSESGLKAQVKAATAKVERDLIARALSQTGGNVTHAARLLKISRKGLQLKMKELGLRNERSD
ncbi:MAG: sigma 54-interacting transcriptional regulator, partial [Myxococcota bacterium]